MKKTGISVFLIFLMFLFSSCGGGPAAPEVTPVPTVSVSPDTAPEPTRTPKPTATPAPTATPSPTATPVPLWEKSEQQETYYLLRSAASANSPAGIILYNWLLHECTEFSETFGEDIYGEPLFIPASAHTGNGAVNQNADISILTVGTESDFYGCGLLAQIIPLFEAESGCAVEIVSGSGDAVIEMLKNGTLDLGILSSAPATAAYKAGAGVGADPFLKTWFAPVHDNI